MVFAPSLPVEVIGISLPPASPVNSTATFRLALCIPLTASRVSVSRVESVSVNVSWHPTA